MSNKLLNSDFSEQPSQGQSLFSRISTSRRNWSVTNLSKSIGSGALSGGIVGACIGPVGAIVGSALGALIGAAVYFSRANIYHVALSEKEWDVLFGANQSNREFLKVLDASTLGKATPTQATLILNALPATEDALLTN